MNYSKGISWFDDCRIPFVDETEMEGVCKSDKTKKIYNEEYTTIYNYKRTGGNKEGRFPSNLLVSDDMLNDGKVVKSSNNWSKKTTLQSPYFTDDKQEIQKDTSYSDKGSNSRYYDIDLWFNNLINNIY